MRVNLNSSMKRTILAVGVDQKEQVWSGHFGMAPQYFLYDHSGFLLEKRKNPYSLEGNHPEQHAGPQRIIRLLSDCSVFIAQKFGDQKKRKIVEDAGIQLAITKEKDVQIAVDAFINEIPALLGKE